MPYDPRAPHHERYVKNPPAYDPRAARARRARRADAVPRARLRPEHRRVRRRGRRAVRDRLHESGAGRRAGVGRRRRTSPGSWTRWPRWPCGRRSSRPQAAPCRWDELLRRALMTTPTFTIGIEEEYQTVDPVTFDLARTSRPKSWPRASARCTSASRPRCTSRSSRSAPASAGTSRTPRSISRICGGAMIALTEENGLLLVVRRDASVRRLARAGHLSRRALPADRRGHADRRAREPDLRPARARRHRGPRDADPDHEPDAVLPAAPAGALDQLAVLDRHEHRAEVVPVQGVRSVPADEHPGHVHSWADFESFVNLLVRTHSIDNAKKIWWDIRPHPFFNTVEIRICDIPMRVDETLAIAALIQATAVKLYRLHARNQSWRAVQPRAADGKQVARRRATASTARSSTSAARRKCPSAS